MDRHDIGPADVARVLSPATRALLPTGWEGGALLLPTRELAAQGEIRREKGTKRAACLRGELDHHEWVEIDTSGTLAEPLAALLQDG